MGSDFSNGSSPARRKERKDRSILRRRRAKHRGKQRNRRLISRSARDSDFFFDSPGFFLPNRRLDEFLWFQGDEPLFPPFFTSLRVMQVNKDQG